MDLISRNIFKVLIFSGLALRLIVIIGLVPIIQATLFSPFIEDFIRTPTIDPWQTWIEHGGQSDAFPYGPVMLIFFGFFSMIFNILPAPFAPQLGIAFGLLAIELWLWLYTWKRSNSPKITTLLLFAISPILIVATYFHGQLDLFPSFLLLIGLIGVKNGNWKLAGLFLGISAATKFSALLLIPFVFIFLIRNAKYRSRLKEFTFWLIPGIAIAGLPLILAGYRTMVAGTPQVTALLGYSIPLGPDFSVLLAPLLIAGFAALVWNFKRANLGMLFTICAIALSSFPLLMPSSPGWYLWGLAPLLIVTSTLSRRYKALVIALGLSEAITVLLESTNGVFRWNPIPELAFNPSLTFPAWAPDMSHSITLLLGLFTLWRVLVVSLRQEDRYKLSSAPLSVLVAGDSGTGKDTLCASLASVFGESRCAFVLGDDYHSFERGASAWGAITHLNPGANDIARLTKDSLELLNGNSVWSRHYDHSRGRFTKARKVSNGDVVAISGLHVISIEPVRKAVDLSVFLDMDNELRTLLKVERDMRERNQAPAKILQSISSRENDRNKYIQPQKQFADLVIQLKSTQPIAVDFEHIPQIPVIDVVATLRSLTFGEELVDMITSFAGAQALLSYTEEPGTTSLLVKSADWISQEDIAAIGKKMIQGQEELFVGAPVWQSGSKGISQLLIVLSLLERRRRKAWRP